VKAALLLLPLAGCYLGAHGSVDLPVHGGSRREVARQGHLDLGLGGADEKQSFALLMSVGTSPLVADGDDPAAPRTTIFSMGGRYERQLSARRPWLRGFGRVLLGGNFCPEEDPPMTEEPDPSCDTPEEARDVGVASLALGLALGFAGEGKPDEITPGFASVGLALVYTYTSDEVLGAADFLGLELSFGLGGDILTGLMREDD
jgi:hypothetical protein